uniref:Protein THEM6-like n=1 Tax=Syphacia muris TaxID=451379 RepID=A0A0N5AH82_9BILA
MWSSPLLLSLTSVFGLLGLALITLALTTDYWTDYQVNRKEIRSTIRSQKDLGDRLEADFQRNTLYFSRNYGLFLICFPDTVPSGSRLKLISSSLVISDTSMQISNTYSTADAVGIGGDRHLMLLNWRRRYLLNEWSWNYFDFNITCYFNKLFRFMIRTAAVADREVRMHVEVEEVLKKWLLKTSSNALDNNTILHNLQFDELLEPLYFKA